MSRRTSRWGDRDNEQLQQQQQKQKQQAVSDDEAMRALLFSAESRTREREGITTNSSSTQGGRDGGGGDKGRGNDNGNRGNRGGSGRGGNNHNNINSNNRHKKDEVSYYGPGGNSSKNEGNDNDNDRKRKRPLGQDQNGPRRVEDDDDKSKEKGTTTAAAADKEGDDDEESRPPPEYKPNFGLSGALAKDTDSGNVYKGVVLKFKEPPEARAPNTQWRLYVFKPQQNKKDDADLIETLHISKQSAYLFGRNTDIADIPLLHPSLSSQHAVLQYRAMSVSSTSSSSLYNGGSSGGPKRLACQPYIMDLESTNGTFLNGVRIDAARYYQLKKGDVLTFGASTREYILLTENTTSAK